jgi:hypothetical protein
MRRRCRCRGGRNPWPGEAKLLQACAVLKPLPSGTVRPLPPDFTTFHPGDVFCRLWQHRMRKRRIPLQHRPDLASRLAQRP